VVTHLQEAFITDWAFVSGEVLRGPAWLPAPGMVGDAWARGIADGPDEDFEKLLMTLLGAISVAQHRLVIVTPYFLPDASLIHALGVASLRGVQVDIVLPEVNNQRIVQWACTAMIWQVLTRGCRVFLSKPPFDHTKLLLIDDAYVLFGSTNWDPRSLRLNFEFNVECYSTSLCEQLSSVVDAKIESARPLTLDDVNQRSLPVQLRDGVARLFTPYI
jgi:cardiolipin synthase